MRCHSKVSGGRRRALACAIGVLGAALACSRPSPPAPPAAPVAGVPVVPGPEKVAEAAQAAQSLSEPAPQGAADGGADVSAPVPGSAPAPLAVAPPTPVPAPLTAAVAITAGQELPLARNAPTAIDPGSSFRLEVAVQLTDGRLVLLDDQDAMVASSGTTEMGGDWTRYLLKPAAPLRPGGYTLRVDGTSSREAHDPTGRAFTPVMLQLVVTGQGASGGK